MLKKFLILFLLALLIVPSWRVNVAAATNDTPEDFVDYPARLNAQLPPPAIASVSPESAYQGQELTLTILGSGFSQQPSLVFMPTTGITITSITHINSERILADIKISSNAPLGPRDVIIFNPDQQSGTLEDGFTVGAVPKAVPGSIKLTPGKAENPVSATHALVATVLDTSKEPLPGVKVVFTVRGANPTTGTAITDSNGQAVFSYQGARPGDDVITAAIDNLTATAYKHWEEKPADTTPPRITSGPVASQITQDSAIISWITDEESDSKVSYDTCADSFRLNREDAQLVTEHQLALVKLEPGRVYQLIVESKDKAGNLVRSRPFVFETESPADKEKPTVSLILPEKLSGRKVIIRADAHDNTDVDKVVFYFDGKPAFTDFTAPFEWEFDAAAHKEGAFHFAARAFDAANNAAEAARDGEISHHFSGELSPVKVRIVAPASGDEVYGEVGISAEIDDEADLGFSYIEFKIDETVLSETSFDPPYYFTPILSPTFIASRDWDSTAASRGSMLLACASATKRTTGAAPASASGSSTHRHRPLMFPGMCRESATTLK